MPKHTPFFKFDSSAWLGGSIQFTDLETKGLFIDLCALYWESQEPIKIDAKLRIRLRCPEGTLSNLVGTLSDLDIITQSEQGITIPFLDKLMEERKVWLKKCSDSGKRSKGTSSNKKEERRKKKEDIKEVKEKINPDSFCPSYVHAELWKAFMEVRKAKKAAQTERALNTLVNQLGKLEQDTPGWANEEINASVVNSWKGIFPDEKRKPKATKRNWY